MQLGQQSQKGHGPDAYRRDVDGLRALAVIMVLLYHGFPRTFIGGFVGVDVFFVISGFLITGIIFDGLGTGTFTFIGFYARRVRRIFPALAVVLLVCPLLGYLMLLPSEFEQLGKHMVAGAAFVSNFAFYREVGYFDASAESKPLLHLWSLAVEEQYYLLWPLVIFALRRHLERARWWIVGIALASFAVNVYLSAYRPSLAFYSPITRFWELMLGGMLAYAARRGSLGSPQPQGHAATVADVAAAAGSALLVAALFSVDNGPGFPGWRALLPTVGTALIIAAGPRAWVNRVIFSHPCAVWVGLISYPLYLWHWPLLTFARIANGGALAVIPTIGILLSSAVLAWLTYRYVERKVRFQRRKAAASRMTAAAAVAVAALGLTGVLANANVLGPRSQRLPIVHEIEAAVADREPVGTERIPGASARTVLFIGDSHMQHYVPRIRAVARSHAREVRSIDIATLGGCTPIPNIERRAFPCAAFIRRAFQRAAAPEVDTVVVSASWEGFVDRNDYYAETDPRKRIIDVLDPENGWVFDGFARELGKLTQQGKRVVIVLSSSRGRSMDPKAWVQRGLTGLSPHEWPPVSLTTMRRLTGDVDRRLLDIAARVHAEVIDPMQLLCTADECSALDATGAFMFTDDSHLRASFVRRSFTLLDRFVQL
jgi:peptidoglycan/LPS O-acetylase OafA/YrhL